MPLLCVFCLFYLLSISSACCTSVCKCCIGKLFSPSAYYYSGSHATGFQGIQLGLKISLCFGLMNVAFTERVHWIVSLKGNNEKYFCSLTS